LIQEKGFLPDLDVVAEEEGNRELKKEEEISSHSKTLFSYPQTSNPECGVAEDKNIDIIFIHEKALVPFFEAPWPCPPYTLPVQGLAQAGLERGPVKIES
jgi:hypothetical protein